MSINPSSLNRISGLVSGMDTDSLVKKLMAGNQAKIDKIKQNQQKKLWLSDSCRQWNSDLYSFRNSINKAKLSSTYNTFSVTSGQPNSVTAVTGGASIGGNYSIQVNKLAQSASFTGKNIIIDPTKSLGDSSQGSFQLVGDSTHLTELNLTVNGQTALISIDPSADKIGDLVNKINSAIDGSGKNLGLQAFYDANLQQFVVKTKATGASQTIDLSVNSGDSKLANYFSPIGGGPTYSTSGQNADIVFNGKPIGALATNTATIMGISWTFKSPTVDSNGVPTTTTVNVAQDIDTEIKNIKDIINNYNDILDKLNKAFDEPVYKDYQPLTDDQRTAMSDKQIEQWETKAKSGLVHGDEIFGGLINKLRSVMPAKVNTGSAYNSLSSIGIASQNYLDKGHLAVDETKLRAAIQADPDGVQNLFNQGGSTSDGTRGLLYSLSDNLTQAIKSLTTKAGIGGASQYDQSVIGKLLSGFQTQINSETDKFGQMESRYYKQFTAMEQAMQKYNSQGSWLSSQLSSSQG